MKVEFIRMTSIPQDTPQKQCTACKEWKDATPVFFHRATKAKDGFQSQCKICIVKPKKPAPLIGYKRCRKCGNDRLATSEHFYADKREVDGLRLPCKQCIKDYSDARREIIHAGQRQHYQENKDSIKKRTSEYAKSHRESCNEYQRLYYAKHYQVPKPPRIAVPIEVVRERNRISYRKRYSKNPEYYKALINKRKARKAAAPGTHTAEQIQSLLQSQKYRCYYCTSALIKKSGKYIYHLDHTFPLSREGASNDISYMVITCPTCNIKKHDKYPWEFFEGGRLL